MQVELQHDAAEHRQCCDGKRRAAEQAIAERVPLREDLGRRELAERKPQRERKQISDERDAQHRLPVA